MYSLYTDFTLFRRLGTSGGECKSAGITKGADAVKKSHKPLTYAVFNYF